MAEEFNGAKVLMAMLVFPISDMVSKAYKGFDILTKCAMLSDQCLTFCLGPTLPTMERAEPQHDCGSEKQGWFRHFVRQFVLVFDRMAEGRHATAD